MAENITILLNLSNGIHIYYQIDIFFRGRLKDGFLGLIVFGVLSIMLLLALQYNIPRFFLYDTNLSGDRSCIKTMRLYAGDFVRKDQTYKAQLDVLQQSLSKYQTNMTKCFRLSLTTEEQHMLENTTAAKSIKSYNNKLTNRTALLTDLNLMEQVSFQTGICQFWGYSVFGL